MSYAAVVVRTGSSTPDRGCVGAPAPSRHRLPEALEEFAVRLVFDRNDTIYGEGQPAGHIYIVTSGCTRICRHSRDGRRHIMAFAFPGDVTGFIGSATYPFSIEAVTESTLIACPRSRLEAVNRVDPDVYGNMMSQLVMGLLKSYRHQFVLSCQNAKERTASFIWETSQRLGLPGPVELPMSRQDIADHLGLTVETVCRALAALKMDGTITTPNPQHFIVKDPLGLSALAEGRNRQQTPGR